jgi:O-succinylbenzoic acid--CoA ligase
MEVDGWLARAAAARPGLVAVETPGASVTYAELRSAALAGAEQLATHGVAPGDRVAIALPAGLEFAVGLHACMTLGAVAVPVDLRLSAAERERIALGAAIVLSEPLRRERAAGAGAGRAPARHDAGTSAGDAPALGLTHDLDRTALIVHTSGTADAPRPVELTYGNLLWSALGSGVALGVDPRERWLCALPLSHVGGLSILVRSAIYATTAVVHERFETDRVLHALRAGEVTLVSLVATTLARLLDAGLQTPPALRCALTGGGPVPPALRERALAARVPVSLTYGLTEVCSQAATLPLAAIAEPGHTAGPALFCTRLRLAQDGEIVLAGPTVAPSARLRDGWLATGDLGELDERGWLRVIGRKADTIVSGGENVAPAEVEAALESHPDVLEAAVLGRADERWGETVVAIVVPRPGRSPSQSDLRSHVAAAIAAYKVPKHFELAAEPLPRTRSGKLLRRELR